MLIIGNDYTSRKKKIIYQFKEFTSSLVLDLNKVKDLGLGLHERDFIRDFDLTN